MCRCLSCSNFCNSPLIKWFIDSSLSLFLSFFFFFTQIAARSIKDRSNGEPTTATLEQPSPVSVLDATFYGEESPSPVKKISNAFKGEILDM